MPRSDSYSRLRGRLHEDVSDNESHISVYNTRTPRKRINKHQPNPQLSQDRNHEDLQRKKLEWLKCRQLEFEEEQRQENLRLYEERKRKEHQQMIAYQNQQEAQSVKRHHHVRSRTIGAIQPMDLARQRSIAARWARINEISHNYDKQPIMPKYQRQKTVH